MAATRKTKPSLPARRKDFGQPVDAFFARQTGEHRAILDALRGLVEKTAPSAESSIKWGMPFYSVDGKMVCALGAHKAHVNLILWGPDGTYDDPKGLLSGEGKMGKHLKLTRADGIPRKEIAGWIKAAVALAKRKQ